MFEARLARLVFSASSPTGTGFLSENCLRLRFWCWGVDLYYHLLRHVGLWMLLPICWVDMCSYHGQLGSHWKVLIWFLAVHNSSIGDLVTDSVTNSVSDPRDL